jgi:hypothetical protein
MPTENDPIIGNWYQHLDKGQCFQIVALDEKNATVELQHFDGDLEEVELEVWYTLDVEVCDEPENWSGPVDIGELDDYGTEITETTQEQWDEPLEETPS